jgi:hypothetical protein
VTRRLACALTCAVLALAPAGCGSDEESEAPGGDAGATPTASPEREEGGKGGYGY